MTIKLFGHIVSIAKQSELLRQRMVDAKFGRGDIAEIGLEQWRISQRPWNRALAWMGIDLSYKYSSSFHNNKELMSKRPSTKKSKRLSKTL